MKIHSIIRNVCLVTAAGCLSAAYIVSGYQLIVPTFVAMFIIWIVTKRRWPFWSASSLLLIYVALAIIGVLLKLSIYLMVVGCIASLVWWDLIHFQQSIADNSSREAEVRLETSRVQSLTTVVCIGLFLTFSSSYINLQFSFGAMVFLVLMAMGGLTYVQYFVRGR
jgi:hypothetical protein